MVLIDGKIIAEQIKAEIAIEVEKIKKAGGKVPHLAAILVGDDGASDTYVTYKAKDCEQVGMKSSVIRFDASISEETLINEIKRINTNPDIDGLIVQLPIPKHLSESRVIETINPAKDVDGFHPMNMGRLVIGLPAYISATPAGILELLRRYKIQTSGKRCVVVGRSNIVGKPISILLAQKSDVGDATVTLCHSRTQNLKEICREADILIAALGKPEFVTADMVKEGAVVIDVGITRMRSENTKSGFKLVGDVKFDEVAPKCSYITPVPGGVGVMTRVALLQNTLLAAKKNIYS
jgi:methylenetetrahydrofolate dehydrogenase (NADP+) / methenyltetrahydrofolate cyclohydrolase